MMNSGTRPTRQLLRQLWNAQQVKPERRAALTLLLTALGFMSAAALSPALAGLLLLLGTAILARPTTEAGRSLLALTLAALAFLGGVLAIQNVPGLCGGVFTLYGLLFMGLSTWTSLRR